MQPYLRQYAALIVTEKRKQMEGRVREKRRRVLSEKERGEASDENAEENCI